MPFPCLISTCLCLLEAVKRRRGFRSDDLETGMRGTGGSFVEERFGLGCGRQGKAVNQWMVRERNLGAKNKIPGSSMYCRSEFSGHWSFLDMPVFIN